MYGATSLELFAVGPRDGCVLGPAPAAHTEALFGHTVRPVLEPVRAPAPAGGADYGVRGGRHWMAGLLPAHGRHGRAGPRHARALRAARRPRTAVRDRGEGGGPPGSPRRGPSRAPGTRRRRAVRALRLPDVGAPRRREDDAGDEAAVRPDERDVAGRAAGRTDRLGAVRRHPRLRRHWRAVRRRGAGGQAPRRVTPGPAFRRRRFPASRSASSAPAA